MTKDYGDLSYEAWERTLMLYKAKFGGGRFFCNHHWGKHPQLPNEIMATVHYDNGVVATRRWMCEHVYKCGKCGRVKGVNTDWI